MKGLLWILPFLFSLARFASGNGLTPGQGGLAGEEQFVPGEFIIQFRPDCRGRLNIQKDKDDVVLTGFPQVDLLNRTYRVIAARPLARKIDEKVIKYNLDLYYLFRLADKEGDVKRVIEKYRSLPEIEGVWLNVMMPVDRIPNDPMFGGQWHLPKMMCPEVWDYTIGDTMVTVAAIDQGVDYGHEDLLGSFWVNRLEDINGNGRFDSLSPPEGDVDGYDQDGNGYPDDVIGFDFVSVDPNPMPEGGDDHGTICQGIITARTNNGVGVASVGWSVRGMNLRCGANGRVYLGQATEGTIYAAQNGVFAISMSFGGPSFYPPLNDAIQYAWERGCVISGSAGNQYSGGAPRYPACYDHVIATAASDQNDRRSVWGGGWESNYAPWVDVSAPGTGVLATTNNNQYISADGTSMSAPCVAGQAALLKSAFPTMTNDECTTRIFLTCDSMPDSLYHQGLLGHGRINIGRAVLSLVWCHLTVENFRINDIAGNNNGVPEPGEICALIVTLKNEAHWQDATNITASLTTNNPFMEVLKGSASFPNIPAGSSGNCSPDSFVIRLRANSPPQRVKFVITKTSTPRSLYLTDNITITCGFPRILLVDDDAGQNYERWYKAACDSLAVLYKLWENATRGIPPADTLRNYPVVIWWTGLDSLTSLVAGERTVLQNYLDNRGNLFLSGANLGQNIGQEPFYENYLRARYVANSSGTLYIYGRSGDPIGVGDSLCVAGTGGANNGRTNDVIHPTGGATATHYYRGSPTSYAGIRYEGTYKLVYFGFPFEAVNHTARYVQKPELLRRILTYFGEQMPYYIEEYSHLRIPVSCFRVRPNPFRQTAVLSFSLPAAAQCQIKIYTADGRYIKTVYSGYGKSGEVSLSAREGLSSGIYFLELVTPFGKERIKGVVIE